MQPPQTFVLTGCASGLGRHMVGVLLREGHHVVATDIDSAALTRAAEEDAWDREFVELESLDVSDAVRWNEVLDDAEKRFGRLDVLMNIAGVLEPDWILDVEPSVVEQHVDTNLKGVIYGTTAAARRMVERGHGHIVNIGSMSSLAPVPGLSVYGATKYGVRAFSLAAAFELRSRGVYVTVVCPDAIGTPMLDRLKSKEAAAMVLAGPSALDMDRVARLILRKVLRRRPLEVSMPWWRGMQARVVNLFPVLGLWFSPNVIRRGLKKFQDRR